MGIIVGTILLVSGIYGLVLFFHTASRNGGFLSLSFLDILWGLSLIVSTISQDKITRWSSWILGLATLTLLSISFLLKYPAFYKKKDYSGFTALGIIGLLTATFLGILFYLVHIVSVK